MEQQGGAAILSSKQTLILSLGFRPRFTVCRISHASAEFMWASSLAPPKLWTEVKTSTQCSWNKLLLHHDTDQYKVLSEDKWINKLLITIISYNKWFKKWWQIYKAGSFLTSEIKPLDKGLDKAELDVAAGDHVSEAWYVAQRRSGFPWCLLCVCQPGWRMLDFWQP